jgi:hypothetical protein
MFLLLEAECPIVVAERSFDVRGATDRSGSQPELEMPEQTIFAPDLAFPPHQPAGALTDTQLPDGLNIGSLGQ